MIINNIDYNELYKKKIKLISGNLDSQCKKTSQPINISYKLKDHQRRLLYAMEKVEKNNKIYNNDFDELSIDNKFVVGDEVGSGKSIVLLSLISNNNINFFHDGKFLVNVLKKKYIQSNLIIVPHNIIYQWENYISKYTKLRFYTIDKNINLISNVKFYTKYDVIICSSYRYNSLADICKGYSWSRVIFDEADNINIPNCQVINGAFNWFISSYIYNLLFPSNNIIINQGITSSGIRNLGYIRNFFKAIENNLSLDNIFKNKSRDNFIKEPIIKIIKCTPPNYINKFFTEELNENDDVKNIISKINCDSDNANNIFKLVSNKYLNSNKCISKERLNFIKNKIKKSKQTTCPICYENENIKTFLSCCNNIICLNCIIKMIGKINCPICREIIDNNNLYVISNKYKNKKKKIKTKIDEAVKLIKNKNDTFIIFSNSRSFLNSIVNELNKCNIEHVKLKGNSNIIKNTISKLKNKLVKIVLVSSSEYIGLSLEFINNLIIFNEDYNIEQQKLINRLQCRERYKILNIFMIIF